MALGLLAFLPGACGMKLLLHPSLAKLPEWQVVLAKRGWEVTVGVHGYDLAVGPDCWHATPAHKEFVELALAHARAMHVAKEPEQCRMTF